MKEIYDIPIHLFIMLVISVVLSIISFIYVSILFAKINYKPKLIYYIEFIFKWGEIKDKAENFPKEYKHLKIIVCLTVIYMFLFFYVFFNI